MMTATDEGALAAEMTAWRRGLHAHPEPGFEEERTAAFVAAKLREFGFEEVVERVGRTGVVATLRRGGSNRAVGLRADMDALRIQEAVARPHQSKSPGLMHACGHDGHTAMLLGAAKALIGSGRFDGTVHFIFQPAEEHGRGALAMMDDGLLERFPFDDAYGLHNLPGLPVGQYATATGPFMAAEDNFEIAIRGRGGHAAFPHKTADALVAACAIVTAMQTVVSRSTDPLDSAVVSVTELLTDGTRNVIAGGATLKGDARSFRPEVSRAIETRVTKIAACVAEGHGCMAETSYTREFVALTNAAEPTDVALDAARAVFGPKAVNATSPPMPCSEDFARILQRVPGNYANIGNGIDSAPLHSSSYDFNDAALIHGARYFCAIVERRLPVQSP